MNPIYYIILLFYFKHLIISYQPIPNSLRQKLKKVHSLSEFTNIATILYHNSSMAKTLASTYRKKTGDEKRIKLQGASFISSSSLSLSPSLNDDNTAISTNRRYLFTIQLKRFNFDKFYHLMIKVR